MNHSIIRVELHKDDNHTPHEISSSYYTQLHDAMAAAGFHRSFTSDKKNYALPPAEYIYFKEATAGAIEGVIVPIAKKIMGNLERFSIVVTVSAGFSFYNLKKE